MNTALARVQRCRLGGRVRRHEARNAAHTVAGMRALAGLGGPDQPVALDRLADVVDRVADPLVRAHLVGKVLTARQRGVGLRLSGASHLPVTGRAPELVTILGNLIDNALDATTGGAAAGPPPLVEVHLDGRGATTELRVSDNGPGVPARLRDRIFDYGTTTKSGSTHQGLGLALVRRLARDAGGDVRLDRTATGASFSVRIPGGTAGPRR